ncbi:MAG: ABC-2 family transporter protein [Chloroflexota bacterium]|nr:ABC-2 family transporter protein [Chloroflexota bacterium]
MRRYLRIIRTFMAAELKNEMAYRLNLLLAVFEMLLVMGTSIGAVLVLYSHTTSLNGWTLPQMIALTGVYYVLQGGVNLVFAPSFEKLMEHVRMGTLDFTLLKPANAQLLLSTRHFAMVRVADLLMGLAIVAVGLFLVGETVSPWALVSFAITLASGVMLVYALLLTLVTLSFWFVRIDNIMAIFWAFTDAGRFPIDLYPGWLRFTLATVVPIGIAVTVPAQAIAGRMPIETFFAMLVGTLVAVAAASWFWRLGLRNYTGASA